MAGVARKSVEVMDGLSRLPPSFDGNPFLYAAALTSVMSIAILGLGVVGWMLRDAWRDRFRLHPTAILFRFRMMMGLVGFAAFLRSLPEVLYLQVYGDDDVSTTVQAVILTGKRLADTSALYFVAAWVLLLVAIYEPLRVALSTGPARAVVIDVRTAWPRLRRPAVLFACIVAVSCAFAYGKVYAS